METTAAPTLTIDEYLASLPADRQGAIRAVRDAVNASIADGYEERMQYGMIAWVVPESVLPATKVYNQQPLCLANLGSQKSHMALYMMGIYGDESERAWFEAAYKKAGKKLDMGKSCVRFRSLDALPLDVIGEAMSRISVERYVASYHAIRAATKAGATTAATAPKAVAEKPAAKTAAKPVAKPAAKAVAAKPVAKAAAAKPAAKASNGKPAAKAASGKAASAKPAAKPAAKQKSGSAKRASR